MIGNDDVLKCLTGAGVIPADIEINADDSLYELGLIDSLGTITLVSELQRKYSIIVPEYDLLPSNFDSINGIARYVNQRLHDTGSN